MKATIIFLLLVTAAAIGIGVMCAKTGAQAMERHNSNMNQLLGGF